QGSALISAGNGSNDAVTEGRELLMKQAMKAGDWVKAELLVLELLRRERKDTYLLAAATIYKELGLNNDALRYIEEVYRKSDDPAILPDYIEILLQAGQDEKVFRLINEGLEKIEDSRIRSKLYVYKSHFSFVRTERLRNLTYAKLEDSTNVEALLLLADYFMEIGDREQALSNLRDAVLIEPDNPLIREKIDKLE
ncbi:MAG: hypothetical protein JW874_16540, partial [Spirochaetales bacterium]|nr:hypothetical protein [Spirochaetales bacterium]